MATPASPTDCTLLTCPLADSFIVYLPSFAGNIAYLAIFALLLVVHLFLGAFFRTWGFLVGMMGGLALEVVGYTGRIKLRESPFEFNNFLLYLIGITIGPVFITGSVYLCLSHLVVSYKPLHSFLAPKTYTFLFIGSDIVALVLQSIGGAITATASDSNTSDTGTHVMVAGLGWQVLSLLAFMILGAQFGLSVSQTQAVSTTCIPLDLIHSKFRFKGFVLAVSVATLAIFIRCIYRVAELSGGFKGSIANNEILFMIFEGPLVMVAVVSLTIVHPGIAFCGQWRATSWKNVAKYTR